MDKIKLSAMPLPKQFVGSHKERIERHLKHQELMKQLGKNIFGGFGYADIDGKRTIVYVSLKSGENIH
jgi:hypothetical protein